MERKRSYIYHLAMAFVLVAAIAETLPCFAQSGGCCARQTGCSKVVRVGGGCCKRVKFWDAYPRPELNPPDDIASLPDIEQQRFVKIFRLVPETIKVKSTQNYRERIVFMRGPQYISITNKLAIKLARSGRMLAQDPAILPGDVLQMCHDTIVYGRSLIMGDMSDVSSFCELAQKYGFKNADKIVEKIEDKRNFKRKDIGAYPMNDPECRDFACLAKAVNPSRWKAFVERNSAIVMQNSGRATTNQTKKQMYDMYDEQTSRPLPADFVSLPNRQRLKFGKMYDLLPVQVIAISGRDYRQRADYAASAQYAKVKDALVGKLSKDARKLSADPAVTVEEILKLADDIVRFGRPLVAGDMRNVSLQTLASRHGYVNVEKFVRTVEDSQYVRSGKQMEWPGKLPEFRDFEHLAKTVYKDRWNAFLVRLRISGSQARADAAATGRSSSAKAPTNR